MSNSPSTAFVPKRGRPKAGQVAAIEQTILSTARRMFLEDGYDAAAMEGVAAAAGVSKGTLYARYPSKPALFKAVVEAAVEGWSEAAAIEEQLLTDDIAVRLHHHGRTIARSLVNPEIQAFQRLIIVNGERFPELSGAMYAMGYLYMIDLLRRDIEAAAARDGLKVRDANGVAHHMLAAITGWYSAETIVREIPATEVEAFAARVVDLLLLARSAW
ncbi:TetR/AcrR family transcriptional regulator [Sphingopyxis witflariensis]|nr:TetR/AcrR family transcriptional regulator [Sphingopyxis witflariensis]